MYQREEEQEISELWGQMTRYINVSCLRSLECGLSSALMSLSRWISKLTDFINSHGLLIITLQSLMRSFLHTLDDTFSHPTMTYKIDRRLCG